MGGTWEDVDSLRGGWDLVLVHGGGSGSEGGLVMAESQHKYGQIKEIHRYVVIYSILSICML